MIEFLTNNWVVLIIGLMAFLKIIVNLTPTEKDNKIFGWIDVLITAIIGNKTKKKK